MANEAALAAARAAYMTSTGAELHQVTGWLDDALESAIAAYMGCAAPSWQPIATAPKDGTQIIGRTTPEQVFACNWFWDDEDETEGDWLEHGADVVRPREWLAYPAPPASGEDSAEVERLTGALRKISDLVDDEASTFDDAIEIADAALAAMPSGSAIKPKGCEP
jgi:hypothetical protein